MVESDSFDEHGSVGHGARRRQLIEVEKLRDLIESSKQLTTQRQEGQSKYAYFLLAAAGAAIAFVTKVTEDSSISWTQLPLGCAIAFWSASFYFGCQRLHAVDRHQAANQLYLNDLFREMDSDPQANPQAKFDLALEIWQLARLQGERQFAFLIQGAICFVAWHIGEMILRTIPS